MPPTLTFQLENSENRQIWKFRERMLKKGPCLTLEGFPNHSPVLSVSLSVATSLLIKQ